MTEPVELTVGRHAAGDGADVHPIVAAALRRRPTAAAPSDPRHCEESRQLTAADGEGGLGWPGEPHTGTGLGWPVEDLLPGAAASREPAVALVSDETPVRRRSGWRRFFGSRAA
jgi:hypothetical protein